MKEKKAATGLCSRRSMLVGSAALLTGGIVSGIQPEQAMKRLTGFFLALLLMCSAAPAEAAEPCRSRNLDFGRKAAGWVHRPMSKLKKDTVYTLIQADGRTVLRGAADGSASFFVCRFHSAMEVPASISWRWKTDALVPGADNRDKKLEDAPLRVIVGFDGDHATLPEVEKKRFKRARSLSGLNLPYALLMYIWSDHVPVNTVIPSAHTGQVKMIVVASGAEGLGQWQTVKRSLADDYRLAFGADPGPVLGVAVMTDTDNTGTRAVGEYADILIKCSGSGAD
jgi:hypothetical protein